MAGLRPGHPRLCLLKKKARRGSPGRAGDDGEGVIPGRDEVANSGIHQFKPEKSLIFWISAA
jgi:hypothetical protein